MASGKKQGINLPAIAGIATAEAKNFTLSQLIQLYTGRNIPKNSDAVAGQRPTNRRMKRRSTFSSFL